VIVAASGVPLASFTTALFAGVLLTGVISTWVLLAGGVLTGGVLAGGFAEEETPVPWSIAFWRAPSLVDTKGQPFPGPFRFWMVIEAALILAD
jgi:hypothetical protein